MKVAIYSRVLDLGHLTDVQLFFEELHKERIVPVVFRDFYEALRAHISLPANLETFSCSEELQDDIEFIISLGGDGTLLDTATLVRDKNIPIAGINFGRLGFLASIGRDEMQEAMRALSRRSYIIDNRSLIHLDASVPLFDDIPYALNEFAIHKRDVSPMVKIHTYINGELLNTYWADGLIVATPTGSTGYSLSCQGPVVFPDSGSFVITPIAPHNLNVRSIVIPDSTILSFEIESRSEEIIVAMDARREIVHKSVQLAVRKEQFGINLVRLTENNFLQTLRNKLSWGFDKRNPGGV
ncbi:MAG: NAD kinase [Chitinophagaceae bacterium]|nr:MAG: NAD kinase [Chitinophagaceae bacterium]